jgi:hypothetical protein
LCFFSLPFFFFSFLPIRTATITTTTTIRFDSGVSCCSACDGTGHPTPTTILNQIK